MPRFAPNHRAEKIIQCVNEGLSLPYDHPYESALFWLLKEGKVILPAVEEAHFLYEDEQYRHVMNALIIGKGKDDDIASGLDLTSDCVSVYRHLFFDRHVFRHALDVITYIRTLDVANDYSQFYRISVEQGPEFLLNKLRVGPKPALDPKQVLRTMTADFYERFLAHRGQQIDSVIAREALKWGKEAMDGAKLLIDKDANKAEHALQDLKVALESKDLTTTPENVGLKLDEIITGTD